MSNWIRPQGNLFWSLSFLVFAIAGVSHSAEVVRNYPMGEADEGAEIGEVADLTVDTISFPTDQGVEEDDGTVPIFGFGTYVEGRNEDSEFAIAFDGVSDYFEGPRFDPRDFGGFGFSTLSQGWIKPSSEGEGLAQVVWAVGNDNGGVGITEEGFWQLNSGGNAGSLPTDTPVEFDEWAHVAVYRTGNNGTLYLNGSVIGRNDGFWNAPGTFVLGAGPTLEDAFAGAIDDFKISGFGDSSFDAVVDIMFLDPDDLSGVLGDVTQDGIVDQADYDQWSANVGFNNDQGVGDVSTLFRGDVDQNGRVDFYDFQIIRDLAAESANAITIPEPSTGLMAMFAVLGGMLFRRSRRRRVLAAALVTCFAVSNAQAEVIVAEDFLYAQPTKAFGAGGGFNRVSYGGGQNGSLGSWEGQWASVGDGVITGSDISEETFVLDTDMFAGVTRSGLSVNWLERDFALSTPADQSELYFGISLRSNNEAATPSAAFTINDALGPAQIGLGLFQGGFRAMLGQLEEGDDFTGVLEGPDITTGLDPLRLIGKLELNAAGDDERLTVWLDPTDVETAEHSIAVEADVVSAMADLQGNLRLDHRSSGGLVFYDDLALGTTWESVASVDVPRLTVFADPDERDVHLQNTTGETQEVTFLQMESERGFNDRFWSSLEAQGLGGFRENNPTSNRYTESSLSGSLNLQPEAAASFGRIYRRVEDIVAHVGTSDGLLNVANVAYEAPVIQEPTVDNDFDDNGAVDVADINALCSEIAAMTNNAAFDLTQEGMVNGDDLQAFLDSTSLLAGDADFDGNVAFLDFLALANAFGSNEATWSSGDFDCTGDVGFLDFLSLANNFGMSAAAAASVPEPSSALLLLGSLVCLVSASRTRRK